MSQAYTEKILHRIEVSTEEFDCRQKVSSKDASIYSALTSPAKPLRHSSVKLELGRAEAEKLRELLTERRAQVAFDKDCEPSEIGRMIEGLIDKLFQR